MRNRIRDINAKRTRALREKQSMDSEFSEFERELDRGVWVSRVKFVIFLSFMTLSTVAFLWGLSKLSEVANNAAFLWLDGMNP